MKKTTRSSFQYLLVLGALALGGALSITGCAAEPAGEEEDTAETEEAVVGCCQGGAYICPATSMDYEYAAPGCGYPKKTLAAAACDKNCNVPCTDTGWSCM